jgi:hypothetical protein
LAQQVLEQKWIAAGCLSAGLDELRLDITAVMLRDQRRDRGWAERRWSHDAGAGARHQSSEHLRSLPRLDGSSSEHDGDRQVGEALGQADQEPQRRAVRPLPVVHCEQRSAVLSVLGESRG